MGSLPDQVYLDEIPKLRAYPNIRTLGYVATHYAEKDIEDVLAEIDVYSRWPKLTNNTKMRVDGIFFDETPSSIGSSDDYAYLKRASQAVRNGTTFKDRFVGRCKKSATGEDESCADMEQRITQASYLPLSSTQTLYTSNRTST